MQPFKTADRQSTRHHGYCPAALPVAYFEIVFGVPSRDCRGYGICRLESISRADYYTLSAAGKPVFNRTYCSLRLDSAESVTLIVNHCALDKFTRGKHFGSDTFIMSESVFCDLPPTDNSSPVVQKGELLPGKYHIFSDATRFYITIKMRIIGN